MLVPSMSLTEIRNEITKDYEIVFRKAGFMAHKLNRLLRPKKDQEVFRSYEYYSPHKNNWLYRVFIKNKIEWLQLMAYCYNIKGLSVYQLNTESGYLIHYTGHFFHRYNERLHLGLSKPTDIIKSFMNDNLNYLTYKRSVLQQGKRKIFCLTETGIILGTADTQEKVYHFNTFIPYTTLYKRQWLVVKQIYMFAQQSLQDALKAQLPEQYGGKAA